MKRKEAIFLITNGFVGITGLILWLIPFFKYNGLAITNGGEIGGFMCIVSALLFGLYIKIKGKIYKGFWELLTKGGVEFRGFGKGRFRNSKLRQEKVIKVIPKDGYWTCPSCKENNKELQDVCSNCGQEISK